MTTTIEQKGRRLYFRGAPYEARGQLRAAGAKWDPGERAWYMGSVKRAQAEDLVEALNARAQAEAQAEREEGVALDARVVRGRASYEGKTYYLLASGTSARTGRPYAKLAFRDGSRVFWARNPSAVMVLRTYDEPVSIESLHAYAERRRKEQAGERECPLCARHCTCGTGVFCVHHHDGCERCGAER